MSHPLLHSLVRLRLAAELRRQGHGFIEAHQLSESLTDDVLSGVIQQVSDSKGVSVPGDGSIFQSFIDFLNAHWADILAIILKLIGL